MNIFSRLFNNEKPTFLSTLRYAERVAISNLTPLIYAVIIQEKKGEGSTPIIMEEESLLVALRKLSVSELEILSQSVYNSMKADNESNPSKQTLLYKYAFELNPYNDLAIMSYGCALANQGNLREGIKWLEKAVKINPKNERAFRNLQGMKAHI